MEFTISIQQSKNGWLAGQCEQLPEAISQGKDMDDLMENMKDAIELCLEYKQEQYRLQNKPNNIMSLIFKHEKKRIAKAPQRERVYA